MRFGVATQTQTIWAQLHLCSLAQVFGGGEAGKEVAAFILEVQRDLPFGTLTGKAQSNPIKPSQTESNQIKPDDAQRND